MQGIIDRLNAVKSSLDARNDLEKQVEGVKQTIRDLKQRIVDKTIEKKV